MAHDQQTLKAFLSDTRTRAADVLDQPHVGADVKMLFGIFCKSLIRFTTFLINPLVSRLMLESSRKN